MIGHVAPLVCLLIIAVSARAQPHPQQLKIASALEAVRHAYYQCAETEDNTSWLHCLKPKILAYLSKVVDLDEIPVSRDLALVRLSNNDVFDYNHEEENMTVDSDQLDAVRIVRRLERFLASHELRARLPKEIASGEVVPYLPQFMMETMPKEVRIPLGEEEAGQGTQVEGRGKRRGFIRRIVIPFLLGLKLKSTLLVPLALTLIALKTWKAMTLGLLSLVLTGAMLIFKLTKQKVVNYEVVHVPHASIEHSDHVGYGRAHDAHELAYRGSRP